MLELLGLDFQDTPAEVRGKLAFVDEQLDTSLLALAAEPELREVAILSTCNRTEVYYTGASTEATQAVRRFLEVIAKQPALAGTSLDETTASLVRVPLEADSSLPITLALYHRSGAAAAEHLLNVASGLRSMVIGEAQILGQVKDALAAAEAVGTAGEEVRLAFSAAVRTGKRTRAETELGRADRSLVSLAVRAASEALGGLDGVRGLVVGAGRTSRLCGQQLRQAGVQSLTFANRTAELAADLARELDARAIALDALEGCLDSVDLVMSATAAPFPILSAKTLASARADVTKPLVIVDLAVPHDVEEAAGTLSGVKLIQLDDLRGDSDAQATVGSKATLVQVETIVAEGLRAYLRERTVRMAVPGITALRHHVDRSEQAERAKVLGELAHLAEADRALVERYGQRLVDKMFHHLVSRIRSLAEFDEVPPDVTMQVLSRLFSDPDAPSLPDATTEAPTED